LPSVLPRAPPLYRHPIARLSFVRKNDKYSESNFKYSKTIFNYSESIDPNTFPALRLKLPCSQLESPSLSVVQPVR
jgi:hypothetical protein